MTSSAASTTVTDEPRATNASAISKPIYPLPTTTTWRGRGRGAFRPASRPAASPRVWTPWTCDREIPGMSGRRGSAPVATCKRSNPS